jgi:hypothetical protein
MRLFSTQAQLPTMLFGNFATLGGGLMVNGSGATACLFDSAITSNTASQQGSAVYVGDESRLIINPDNGPECDFAAVAALGAVHCDPTALDCNRFGLNSAPYIYGSVLYFTGAARIDAQRLHFEGNNAAYAILGEYAEASAQVAFRQCLLNGNTARNELIKLNGAAASFDGCTIADNSIGAGHVFAFDTGLSLTRSIVREAGSLPVYDPGNAPNLVAQYLMLSGPNLPTDSTVVYGDPGFVDAANSNYRLQALSSALDYAPASAGGTLDFDRNPRVADLTGVTDLHGPRDLGAFEYPLPDKIFRNGFEQPPP